MRIKVPMISNDRLFEISAKIDQLESILELCDADQDGDILSDLENQLVVLVAELSFQDKPHLHAI